MSQDQNSGGGRRRGEWAVGVLSGVLLIGLLGFLAYQAVAVRGGPPELRVSTVLVEGETAPYVLKVRVQNDGGQTAQQVQISGDLTRGATTVEQASATVNYLPPDSHRNVSLVFQTDPDTAEVSAKAAGYTLP